MVPGASVGLAEMGAAEGTAVAALVPVRSGDCRKTPGYEAARAVVMAVRVSGAAKAATMLVGVEAAFVVDTM